MLSLVLIIIGAICLRNVQCGNFVVSPVLYEEYLDGPGGHCTFSETRGSPLCRSGWKKNNTIKGPRVNLPHIPACMFYTNTIHYVCRESTYPSEGKTKKSICVRKRPFYVLRTDCYTHWLQWDSCSKTCGGGIRLRYKFTDKFSYNAQASTCNAQPCPTWTAWSPMTSACDDTCYKTWARNCTYNGNAVNGSKCPTGPSIQRRPCPVLNCSSFVEVKANPTTARSRMSTSDNLSKATTTVVAKNLSMINPRLAQKNHNPPISESQGDLGSGVGIGFGIATFLFIIAAVCSLYIYRRIKERKLTKSLGGQHAVSTLPGHHTNTNMAAANGRSSILRNTVNTAPVARISPSAIYLEPGASDRQNSIAADNANQRLPAQPDVAVYQQSEEIMPTYPLPDVNMDQAPMHGAGADNFQQINSVEDPIYADIPAYDTKRHFSDDFTSDEFDSCDDLDPGLHGVDYQRDLQPFSSDVVPIRSSRPHSQSFVQSSSREPTDAKVKRSATQKYSDLTDSEDRRLRNLGPPPDRPVVQQPNTSVASTNHFLESSRRPVQENKYTRPFKLKNMPQLTEASRENLADKPADKVGDVAGRSPSHIASRFVFEGPDSRRKSSGSYGERSSDGSSVVLRARHPSPPHTPFLNRHSTPSRRPHPAHSPPPPPTSVPGRSKRMSICSSGSVPADSEFGIRIMPKGPSNRGVRLSSSGSEAASSILPDDAYREPADANLPLIEDAYNTYNLPYKPRV